MPEHIPRKRFGQHFLHDKRVITNIVKALDIQPGDIWVEIGPGQGALTHALPLIMAQLHLIEIDNDLAANLIKHFNHQSKVNVINQDILSVDFRQLYHGGQKLRVVGNLPYNISTPIFFHLAKFVDYISDMTFMVQKEVADRLVSPPGNKTYGRLSLSAGLRFEIKKLFDVGTGAFNPPPKVRSSVIQLNPRSEIPSPQQCEQFDLLVRTAFSQRRKTLRKSLAGLCNQAIFTQAGIDPVRRPETLSIDEFLNLTYITLGQGTLNHQ